MRFSDRIKGWLWPTTRCVVCGGRSEEEHPGLCGVCYEELLEAREKVSFCARCGRFYGAEFRQCPGCFGAEGRFLKNGLFVGVPYDGIGGILVRKLKYNNRRDLLPTLVKLFFRYSEIDTGFDVVTAVPLHRRRLRERGFNQSEELARAIAEGMSLPYEPLLERVIDTPSQTTLNYRRRCDNMRGAFEVMDREKAEGRRVLLVDDVVTTGATAGECVAVLKKAGAKRAAIAAVTAGKVR